MHAGCSDRLLCGRADRLCLAELSEKDTAPGHSLRLLPPELGHRGGICPFHHRAPARQDRKSTRLNSSHGYISYAVFCLKKKKKVTNKYMAAITDSYIDIDH